jgi:outer membrane receptor protein involved in Fe transport
MTHHTIIKTTCPPRRAALVWLRALPSCILISLTAVAAHAQTDDAALKAKDAQIAALQAQVAQLTAQLGQAPAPAAPVSGAPAPAAGPTTASGALAPAASLPPADSGIVRMSAFDVRTTAGAGYSAGNSASALKTSDSLMDLPAQVIVVTNDMIKDIGSNNASDVLAFAGVTPYYRGPAIVSRGSRIGNPYIDDVPQATGIGISDNTNIDTYQVIKGPEQVMYPLASLGGLVLETTKKPLPDVTQYIVDERVQEWGRQNFTFDANTPIGNIGDVKLTARVEGEIQTGSGPFKNVKDDRYGLFPNLELDWKNTTVVAEYDSSIFYYLPGGTGILTPTGDLYTGLGRRNMNTPPKDYDKYEQRDARLEWTQRLSDTWQVKTQGTYFNVGRYGSAGFPSLVNWNNNTMTYTIRKDNAWNANFTVQTDVSGKYNAGIFPMTTAFGLNDLDTVSFSKYLTTVPTQTIPIGNAAAIEGIVFPSVYAYPVPANPGSRNEQYVTNGYLMQSIDVIPNWLTLVGGFTASKIETVTDTNLASGLPYVSTDANGHDLLHRYAAIGHLSKVLSVYATESTTYSPGTGVNYANQPNSPVQGKSDEVGVKVSYFDQKLSFSAALYKMTLSNQTILAAYPALNPAGLNYYIPIGNTNSHGVDGSMTIDPTPGLQLVFTGYMGTVHDTNGNPIPATVEDSWSAFGRYDFTAAHGPDFLHGLALGGGANKAGGKWFTMSGLTLPNGAKLPVNSSGNSIFKLHQDVLLNLFAEYRLNHHWMFRLNCENVLDKSFPIGAQGVGLVDPVDPRTFSLESSYKY